MIVKVLGFLDLLCAVSVILLQFGFLPWNLALAAAVYLVAKGFVFRESLTSIFDIASGAYIVLMIFGVKFFLAYVIAAYLLQKALFSFF